MNARDKRLAEIRERHAASTPGEWVAHWDFVWGVETDTTGVAIDIDKNDADFIAHAHQDVPFLLAEIERQNWLLAFIEGGDPELLNSARAALSWEPVNGCFETRVVKP